MSNWTAADGTIIHYEMYGGRSQDKPQLVLLPGLLGTIGTQWRHFIKPLSADYRLILMDLRGHGRSQNNASSLGVEQLLHDLTGLLDQLQVETAHVAGYSLGGYIGLMFALNQPRRVRSLLMHATKFFWTPEAAEKFRMQMDPDMLAEKVPAYADQLVQDHGARQWRILVRQAADLTNDLVSNGIPERTVAHVQCPTMISVGDRDELVPVSEALRLSRGIPQGQLLVLPNVRHPFQTVRLVPMLPMMQSFHS
jgi:pimeloyl-ACP methyl ester carboxylesterase